MIQNWAVLRTVYQVLHEFLTEQHAEQALPIWQDAMAQTVQAVQHERAGDLFLNALAQLLGSGEAVLMAAVRSRYRHEPALLAWLAPFMQLRL